MAVADDNKGHIVDFLKIFMKIFHIFLRKKRGKNFSRDIFDYFLVSTCSQGYYAYYKNSFENHA